MATELAKKLCFVIMPFSKTKSCTEGEWTSFFEGVIRPSVEGAGLGYECRRSSAKTGNLIRDILQDLNKADVVIADLTDQRPNVFYELGVRHTLRNRTILIAARKSDIPSDLAGYAHHIYSKKTTDGINVLQTRLRDLITGLEVSLDRSDNPVADFLEQR